MQRRSNAATALLAVSVAAAFTAAIALVSTRTDPAVRSARSPHANFAHKLLIAARSCCGACNLPARSQACQPSTTLPAAVEWGCAGGACTYTPRTQGERISDKPLNSAAISRGTYVNSGSRDVGPDPAYRKPPSPSDVHADRAAK